jgi:hypothetical protein
MPKARPDPKAKPGDWVLAFAHRATRIAQLERAGFPSGFAWYVTEHTSVPGGAVKGDRVEIVVDTGDGAKTYEVSATKAGRRVEVSTIRGVVEVNEVTRTGTVVRTARFMASRVIALVEHPADTSAAG